MDIARDIFEGKSYPTICEGAKGTIVLAREQVAGRGRNARPWVSNKDDGLFATCVIPCPIPSAQVVGFSLAVGVMLSDALERFGAPVKLKWPNDLYVWEERLKGKLGGVLIELLGSGERKALSIGFGLNLRNAPAQFGAVSLDQIVPAFDPFAVSALLATSVFHGTEHFFDIGLTRFLERFRSKDLLSGLTILADSGTRTEEGVAAGISDAGSLLLRRQDGEIIELLSSDVHIKSFQ